MKSLALRNSPHISLLKLVMAIAVVLAHVHCTYASAVTEIWPLKDPFDTSAVLNATILLHYILMPLFFFISGLTARNSFNKKTPERFWKDGATRLAVPLVLGLLILEPWAAWGFSVQSGGNILASFNLGHLWYLYFLILFYVLAPLVLTNKFISI